MNCTLSQSHALSLDHLSDEHLVERLTAVNEENSQIITKKDTSEMSELAMTKSLENEYSQYDSKLEAVVNEMN